MRVHPDSAAPALEHANDWRRLWLNEYTCDMPSVVPYPQIPLSGLLDRAARLYPDHTACTLYGQATTFAGSTIRPAVWPRLWSNWVPDPAGTLVCCCRTSPNISSRFRRCG